MANAKAIKAKIKSISNIQKITSALEVVSTVKLQKVKQQADNFKQYMNEFLRELGKEPEIEGGLDHIKKILIKAFGEEKAKSMIEKIGTPLKKVPFYTLANILLGKLIFAV